MADDDEPDDDQPELPFDSYDLEDTQCTHIARCVLEAGHKGVHRYKVRSVRRRPDLAANPGADHAAIQRDPRDTAEYAKWSVMPKTGSQRLAVLEFIIDRGETGATHQEIFQQLHLSYSAATTRSQELEQGGWIVDSGRRRDTIAGNPAIVWVLSEEGRWRLKELDREW